MHLIEVNFLTGFLKWFLTLGIIGPHTAEDQGRKTGSGYIKIGSRGFLILVNSLNTVTIPMKCAMKFLLIDSLDFQFLHSSKTTVKKHNELIAPLNYKVSVNLPVRKSAQSLCCRYYLLRHSFFGFCYRFVRFVLESVSV